MWAIFYVVYANFTPPIMETNKKEDEDMMKEMFKDYKTMVLEPAKEFDEKHRKEIIMLSLAVHAIIVGGTMVWINRKNIKESIKSKFNRGKRKTES